MKAVAINGSPRPGGKAWPQKAGKADYIKFLRGIKLPSVRLSKLNAMTAVVETRQ